MLSSETLDVSTRIHIPIFGDILDYRPLVYGQCNGILCLFGHRSGFALWSPATREIKSLPRPTFTNDEFRGCAFMFMTFGHDPKTDDYKIFRFLTCSNIQKMELHTFKQLVLETNGHRCARSD